MNTLQRIAVNWPAPQNVVAYTTCRAGGYSLKPYDSLNMAQHVGDEPSRVSANRALLPMGENIVWLQQTHSNDCAELSPGDQYCRQIIRADASFSNQPNLVCAVMTADCLPILLCNKQGTCVSAIHAGWRGLAGGIIENSLNKLPCANHQLIAWLGPAISQQHFEVGAQVKGAFPGHDAAFTARGHCSDTADTFMADIYHIARQKLRENGINAIYGGEYCSYEQADLFFSHRRATHQGFASTGRMASCIYFH
ncbi:MAG: YfiH family protein [Paraglaciecola sp.]